MFLPVGPHHFGNYTRLFHDCLHLVHISFPKLSTTKEIAFVVACSDPLPELGEIPEEPSSILAGSTQVVPESPENHEGHTNVSGTTLGPNDDRAVESQPWMKVMDHLPFIQAQATLVMNVLIPPSLSPDSILAEAKKLRDSAHPNTKRLNRSIQGLTDEIQDSPLATEGDILIDISHFRPGISPPQLEASISDVHMTNCASLAFVMFCQSTGEPHSQAIEDLDDLFPLCLMENIAHNPESRKIGTSVTQDTTFSLALSIRTQFFIIEIERRQQELNFNPVSILRQIFCKDLTPSEDNHENPGSFRGFKLPGVFEDEEGHLPEALPEKLRQSVSDRFSDLYEEISEWDGVDVDGLKKAYKWRAFERDLARWIHARSREIREDIRRVSDKLTQSSSPARRYTPLSVGPPAGHTPARTPVVANSTPQKQNLANVPHAASQAASINSPPAPSPQRVPATSPRPPAPSPQKAPIRVSFDEAESPVVNNQTSRKRHGYDNVH